MGAQDGAESVKLRGTTQPSNGAYEIDGRRYPRVTTILGIISKPGLWQWRLTVGATEADRISREAAERGTAVHRLCEDLDAHRLAFCPDDLEPFVTAYRGWRDRHVAEVVASERVVVHARHRYAGQLDRVYRLTDGTLALADLKTSKSRDGTWPLQLAAYASALAEMGEPVTRRMVVHLPSNRLGVVEAIDYPDHDVDDRAWRACVRLWRYWEAHRNDYRIGGNGR